MSNTLDDEYLYKLRERLGYIDTGNRSKTYWYLTILLTAISIAVTVTLWVQYSHFKRKNEFLTNNQERDLLGMAIASSALTFLIIFPFNILKNYNVKNNIYVFYMIFSFAFCAWLWSYYLTIAENNNNQKNTILIVSILVSIMAFISFFVFTVILLSGPEYWKVDSYSLLDIYETNPDDYRDIVELKYIKNLLKKPSDDDVKYLLEKSKSLEFTYTADNKKKSIKSVEDRINYIKENNNMLKKLKNFYNNQIQTNNKGIINKSVFTNFRTINKEIFEEKNKTKYKRFKDKFTELNKIMDDNKGALRPDQYTKKFGYFDNIGIKNIDVYSFKQVEYSRNKESVSKIVKNNIKNYFDIMINNNLDNIFTKSLYKSNFPTNDLKTLENNIYDITKDDLKIDNLILEKSLQDSISDNGFESILIDKLKQNKVMIIKNVKDAKEPTKTTQKEFLLDCDNIKRDCILSDKPENKKNIKQSIKAALSSDDFKEIVSKKIKYIEKESKKL